MTYISILAGNWVCYGMLTFWYRGSLVFDPSLKSFNMLEVYVVSQAQACFDLSCWPAERLRPQFGLWETGVHVKDLKYFPCSTIGGVKMRQFPCLHIRSCVMLTQNSYIYDMVSWISHPWVGKYVYHSTWNLYWATVDMRDHSHELYQRLKHLLGC